MTLSFTKMHGIGNDYIYIDCTQKELGADPGALALRLSDRNRSVGGNGLVLILPSDTADFRMRMFNSDGSEGSMCGNAIRCVGKYVFDNGMTDKTDLIIETKAGLRSISLQVQEGAVQSVRVNMGIPTIDDSEINVTVNNNTYQGRKIDMGNPHFVIFNTDVANAPVRIDGPIIETLEHFPDRTNVEFVQVLSPTKFKMRVWERGSGETLACGTGACASAMAAITVGISPTGQPIEMQLPGGSLFVEYDGKHTYMTGPAEKVFDGVIEL